MRRRGADEQAVIRRWSRDPRNVATARGELLNTLALWGLGEVADAGVLVLSELLTNGLCHAHASPGAGVETWFLRTRIGVRIEVHDPADEPPLPRHADAEATDGRGLLLVTAMAESWGVVPRAGVGKVVFAELAVSARGGSGPAGRARCEDRPMPANRRERRMRRFERGWFR